jgi:bromodomain-containing factor 1
MHHSHPSPVATPPADVKADLKAATESNHIQNTEAFSSNKDLPVQETPAEIAASIQSEKLDAEMADIIPTAVNVAAPDASLPEYEDTPAPKPTEAVAPPAEAPAAESKPATLQEAGGDVEMADARQPSPPPEPAESTQETQQSEVNLHPASMSSLAIDTSQQEPAVPTADTSLDDVPSQKAAQKREADESDEPSAKRARTDDMDIDQAASPAERPALDEVTVAQPMAVDEPVADEAVDDTPVVLPPRTRVKGPDGSLGDPKQDDLPISGYANKEIRRVLASVKKTKAGGLFKDPVSSKWPGLWGAYIAKIKTPVDISSMEKGLRENRYATLADFFDEVYLLWENAIQFNGPTHDITLQAKSLVDNIWSRLAEITAQEPPKPEKKEAKAVGTRHAEPRAAAQAGTQARRESRGGAAVVSPTEESAESQVFAVPSSGVPIIRRDSTKNDGDRPKRPIHPPKNKDLGYEPKNLKKKKMSPEFRFCDEVLKELMKQKHWAFNQWFLKPVDPVKDNAPSYHKVIKKPMDMGTMQEKLNMGEYATTKDFENDFKLIISNCRKFNGDAMPSPAAGQLYDLFKQKWAEKEQWLAAYAAAAAGSASASSPSGAQDESEDDEDADDQEAEEEDAPLTSTTLSMLEPLWKEAQEKLAELMAAKIPNDSLISTQNQIVQLYMKQIIDEKRKLAESAPKGKKKAAKPKAAKPKKAAGAAGAKKAAPGGKKGGGPTKKAARRVMGQPEKDAVAHGINDLEGNTLERAIEIIKKDTHQEVSLCQRSDVSVTFADHARRRATPASSNSTSISSRRRP